jgi:sulfonate transport system permease protein
LSLDLEVDGDARDASTAQSARAKDISPSALRQEKPTSSGGFGARVWAALVPWALPILLLAVWEGTSRAGFIPARVLPAPTEVAIAFWENAKSGALLHHVAISTERALKGLLIGGSIGFLLGVLNGASRQAEALLDSLLQMLRNVPHLAIIPLVILWFGIDEEAKIFLVAIGVFFPIYLNTFHGIRTVDKGLIEMARVYGLSPFALFWRVILPGALPSVLVGLRYSLGIMWLTLIVAETISSNAGIGYMTMNAREFLQTDVVLLGIIIYAALGKAADSLTRALEARALAWHPSYQKAQGASS